MLVLGLSWFCCMIVVGFSKEVIVWWLFVKIKFGQVCRCVVGQPVVTWTGAVVKVEWPSSGASGLLTWFMSSHET